MRNIVSNSESTVKKHSMRLSLNIVNETIIGEYPQSNENWSIISYQVAGLIFVTIKEEVTKSRRILMR